MVVPDGLRHPFADGQEHRLLLLRRKRAGFGGSAIRGRRPAALDPFACPGTSPRPRRSPPRTPSRPSTPGRTARRCWARRSASRPRAPFPPRRRTHRPCPRLSGRPALVKSAKQPRTQAAVSYPASFLTGRGLSAVFSRTRASAPNSWAKRSLACWSFSSSFRARLAKTCSPGCCAAPCAGSSVTSVNSRSNSSRCCWNSAFRPLALRTFPLRLALETTSESFAVRSVVGPLFDFASEAIRCPSSTNCFVSSGSGRPASTPWRRPSTPAGRLCKSPPFPTMKSPFRRAASRKVGHALALGSFFTTRKSRRPLLDFRKGFDQPGDGSVELIDVASDGLGESASV